MYRIPSFSSRDAYQTLERELYHKRTGAALDSRRISTNVTLYRVDARTVGVRLFFTTILEYSRDGTFTVNLAGWHTNVTRRWINEFLPAGWILYSHYRRLELAHQPFEVLAAPEKEKYPEYPSRPDCLTWEEFYKSAEYRAYREACENWSSRRLAWGFDCTITVKRGRALLEHDVLPYVSGAYAWISRADPIEEQRRARAARKVAQEEHLKNWARWNRKRAAAEKRARKEAERKRLERERARKAWARAGARGWLDSTLERATVETTVLAGAAGWYAYKTFGHYHRPPAAWDIRPDSILLDPNLDSSQSACGAGINVATLDWVLGNARPDPSGAAASLPVWRVIVLADDYELGAVVVPEDTDGKFRASRVVLDRVVQ